MQTNLRFRINSPQVINEVLDGEAVIIHLETGNYYSTDRAGAEIWDHIGRGCSVPDILEALAGRYRAGREEIEAAVTHLIEELRREDLIAPVETSPAGTVAGDGTPTPATPRDGTPPAAGSGRPPAEDLEPLVPPVLHKYTDMQELLLLDPIHEVDETGWPQRKEPD